MRDDRRRRGLGIEVATEKGVPYEVNKSFIDRE